MAARSRNPQDAPVAASPALGRMDMFVVDASGMVGRLVAETLLEQGRVVRVLVRDPRRREEWLARGALVTVVTRDGSDLAQAGAQGVFVRLPEFTRASPLHRQRRDMVDRFAAAITARVPHVVLLSTALADSPSGRRPYAEKALRSTGAQVTTLRSSYSQENALPTARVIAALAARRLLHPPERCGAIDLVGSMYSLHRFAHKLGAERGAQMRVLDVWPTRGSAWS
jgi:uncharacterized protein YbjT (DUF2867 family)